MMSKCSAFLFQQIHARSCNTEHQLVDEEKKPLLGSLMMQFLKCIKIPNFCLVDGAPRILKNLYRLYDNLNRSNLLLTDRIEYEKMRKDPKYTDLGTIGSVSPEEDPMCPELLPIYCIYSPLQRSHYYITDELLLKVRLSEGYENKGIIGYAAPGYGACDAFTRIYEFYSPYSKVIQFADLEWAEKFMRGQGGHAYQGTTFAIW
ncbi:hypothetical protein T01_239 [Trichinella spiralis]|uniref:DUF5648 domain-containing protein n=1 Tax=Trichinella spiralis TaxID=6334 RepID=A0A0V1BXF4_TRISP|nr:hypothetical protein T01_239 [Trichinella spiralis]